MEVNTRYDSIDKYYKPINILNIFQKITFWLSVAISILLTTIDFSNIPVFLSVFEILFVLFVICNFFILIFLKYNMLPNAERKRTQHLLSNSLGVNLSDEITTKYYNNQISPSICRLGISTLENMFFTKFIINKMIIRERLFIFLYAIFWFIMILCRNINLNIIIAITQIVFSSNILEEWVSLECYSQKVISLFEELYKVYSLNHDFSSESIEANILDIFTTYEATKSTFSVLLSSKLFSKYNQYLSIEWEKKFHQLSIPE